MEETDAIQLLLRSAVQEITSAHTQIAAGIVKESQTRLTISYF
jgi:hypothetical protein